MANRACSRPGCGMAKSADIHSRHYRGEDGHEFDEPALVVKARKRIQARSDGYEEKMDRRRTHTRPMYEQECIAKVLGAHTIPPCSGDHTVHEPWTRGRGGPIDNPLNMVPMCAFHNTWVSQDVEGQRWAEANDLLIHAWESEAWMSAGGVRAPKGWRAANSPGNHRTREGAAHEAAPVPIALPKRSRLR